MSERERDFVCDWVNGRRAVRHGVIVEKSFKMFLKLEGRVELEFRVDTVSYYPHV